MCLEIGIENQMHHGWKWSSRADKNSMHVIGFYDPVDLWVIKIKSPWSFANVVRRLFIE